MDTRMLLGAIALAGGVAACVADTTADPKVPTLSAGQLARTIEQYPGRTVRVCGEVRRMQDAQGRMLANWKLGQPNDPHPHEVGVQVIECPGQMPSLDKNGCVSGRIAYKDGLLDNAKQPKYVTVTDEIMSYVWYLHPVCNTVYQN